VNIGSRVRVVRVNNSARRFVGTIEKIDYKAGYIEVGRIVDELHTGSWGCRKVSVVETRRVNINDPDITIVPLC
jgi:hypothetical protein